MFVYYSQINYFKVKVTRWLAFSETIRQFKSKEVFCIIKTTQQISKIEKTCRNSSKSINIDRIGLIINNKKSRFDLKILKIEFINLVFDFQ